MIKRSRSSHLQKSNGFASIGSHQPCPEERAVTTPATDIVMPSSKFLRVSPQNWASMLTRRCDKSKAKQEQHLLELIETGDRISAVKVVKLLYKFNTTEAMKFVDEFTMRAGKS